MSAHRPDPTFLAFFAIYTAIAIFLLGLGFGSALGVLFPWMKDALHAWAQIGSLFSPLWGGIAAGSGVSEGLGQVVLDYLLSLLNLVLGVFLVWRRPEDRVVRLLALGMVGTAAAFNRHAHGVVIAMNQSVAPIHLAIHAIAGATYVHAFLLFPNGQLVPHRLRALLTVIYVLMGLELALSLPRLGPMVTVFWRHSCFRFSRRSLRSSQLRCS
ncbi:MAG: hypothetical protein HY331_06535 [Chloroflexi bacterium]|nr:hypothetical protein [Chloroflexota bacterium]